MLLFNISHFSQNELKRIENDFLNNMAMRKKGIPWEYSTISFPKVYNNECTKYVPYVSYMGNISHVDGNIYPKLLHIPLGECIKDLSFSSAYISTIKQMGESIHNSTLSSLKISHMDYQGVPFLLFKGHFSRETRWDGGYYFFFDSVEILGEIIINIMTSSWMVDMDIIKYDVPREIQYDDISHLLRQGIDHELFRRIFNKLEKERGMNIYFRK